jgi:hypothetical protein
MSTDYIPAPDAEFDGWFKNLIDYVDAQCVGARPRWTHIPEGERVELRASYDAWQAAYGKTLTPHTKADTTSKNEARKESEAKIRPFVNKYLRHEPVTDADRDNMFIHNRKAWEAAPDPSDQVSVEVRLVGQHILDVLLTRIVTSGSANTHWDA